MVSKEKMERLEAEMARLESAFEGDSIVTEDEHREESVSYDASPFHSMLDMVSEPWLLGGEAVCPETHLTYNEKLPSSPHVNDDYHLIGEAA